MAKELSVSVEVAAPQQRVWDVLVDWPRQGEWIPATTVRVVGSGRHGVGGHGVAGHGVAGQGAGGQGAGGQGVGGRIEARTGFGPFRVLDRMIITEWQPPRRCAVEHTGRVIRGAAWFEVLDGGAGRSRVVWTERLAAPFGLPDAVVGLLLRPATALLFRAALRRLGRKLAVGQGSPRS